VGTSKEWGIEIRGSFNVKINVRPPLHHRDHTPKVLPAHEKPSSWGWKKGGKPPRPNLIIDAPKKVRTPQGVYQERQKHDGEVILGKSAENITICRKEHLAV